MVDGQAVKQARELAGFTQAALAKKLGVDRSSIAYWESSTRQPSAANFKKLCRLLGVGRDSLLVVSDDRAA
jgi:transcriptional regulator with XRE-family HTH domain